jgi:hypothetical protein
MPAEAAAAKGEAQLIRERAELLMNVLACAHIQQDT